MPCYVFDLYWPAQYLDGSSTRNLVYGVTIKTLYTYAKSAARPSSEVREKGLLNLICSEAHL